MKARREAKKEVNRLREEEAENKRLRRQLKKLEAVKAKLESAGITTSALNLSSQMPSTGKTPVMQVDEDMSPDITLKTPPHVKKIKSRDGSISQIDSKIIQLRLWHDFSTYDLAKAYYEFLSNFILISMN